MNAEEAISVGSTDEDERLETVKPVQTAKTPRFTSVRPIQPPPERAPLRSCSNQSADLTEQDEVLEEKAPIPHAQLETTPETRVQPHSPPTKKRAVERPPTLPSSEVALRPSVTRTRGPICAPLFAHAPWPHHVAHLASNFNPDGITVPYVAEDGQCGCSSPCRHDTCLNAAKHIFCKPSCCVHGAACGNRLVQSKNIALFQDLQTKSLGLVATSTIAKGTTIGQYLGRLTLDRPSKERVRNRGYRLLMNVKPKDSGKWRVCIDAEVFGSLMRFANHSCTPTAAFLERSNGSTHTVVVATLREVHAGQELTINYGKELWFVCRCGQKRCVHRNFQDQADP